MRIHVTMPEGKVRASFFPAHLRKRLDRLGTVTWNDTGSEYGPADLRERIEGVEVFVTGWGSPQIDEAVLAAADDLRLVAHTGGSVGSLVSEAVYERGVPVVSANDVMATLTAEHAIAAILASRRGIARLDDRMKAGERGIGEVAVETLHGATVGLVGLGTVGRTLLEHLAPFDGDVRIYDPYVEPADVGFGFAELTDLDEALDADVVSVHAARTPETVGMLGAAELAALPDGALFVNTARAEIVDEEALLAELRAGRISAVLDVFHDEPLPEDHELRSMENVLLTPHVGGSQIRPPLTEAVIEEIERFRRGQQLRHEIPREQWETMTR